MALGLPTDQRGQIMALLILVALAGGYFFWTKVHQPQSAQIEAETQQADSLEKIVEAAKRDLASGSIEDLRRRVEEYNGSLELMRRLVPDRNEVPTLIDDISTKAKVRGVTLGKIQPLTPDLGTPFDTYRYRLEVYGHYDQIGEYLAGAYASAATLASRLRQLETGAGEVLDLSMLEAHILGLTYYPVTFFQMLGRP